MTTSQAGRDGTFMVPSCRRISLCSRIQPISKVAATAATAGRVILPPRLIKDVQRTPPLLGAVL